MTDNLRMEWIARRRYHGLYLSRKCGDITELSLKLLGLHCWFHRNVVFSSLIRGADVAGWKHTLTKTWLYRGTLHGVAPDDLPKLLSLHSGECWLRHSYSDGFISDFADEVLRCMEDGIYSRAEMRRIFARQYEPKVIEDMFSSWGGIFVYLAGLGMVAFRDMGSRDFDLIDAAPSGSPEEVLPELLQRYFRAYGPATLDDAEWFFGFSRDEKKTLRQLSFEQYPQFEFLGKTYYHCGEPDNMNDLPAYNLLSGFDPFIVSYLERSAVLPPEYKKKIILKSGICLPSIAVNGRVSGIWNIKKGEPVVEFFEGQPKRVEKGVFELVDGVRHGIAGSL